MNTWTGKYRILVDRSGNPAIFSTVDDVFSHVLAFNELDSNKVVAIPQAEAQQMKQTGQLS